MSTAPEPRPTSGPVRSDNQPDLHKRSNVEQGSVHRNGTTTGRVGGDTGTAADSVSRMGKGVPALRLLTQTGHPRAAAAFDRSGPPPRGPATRSSSHRRPRRRHRGRGKPARPLCRTDRTDANRRGRPCSSRGRRLGGDRAARQRREGNAARNPIRHRRPRTTAERGPAMLPAPAPWPNVGSRCFRRSATPRSGSSPPQSAPRPCGTPAPSPRSSPAPACRTAACAARPSAGRWPPPWPPRPPPVSVRPPAGAPATGQHRTDEGSAPGPTPGRWSRRWPGRVGQVGPSRHAHRRADPLTDAGPYGGGRRGDRHGAVCSDRCAGALPAVTVRAGWGAGMAQDTLTQSHHWALSLDGRCWPSTLSHSSFARGTLSMRVAPEYKHRTGFVRQKYAHCAFHE